MELEEEKEAPPLELSKRALFVEGAKQLRQQRQELPEPSGTNLTPSASEQVQ